MNCPDCGKELIPGDVVTRVAPIGFYPKNHDESEGTRMAKMFFGSKSAIGTDGIEEAGYCPACGKITVIFNAKRT